jgi:hypothetical protein
MSVRFRYLAASGREVEIGTTGELVRAFLSGHLNDNTLLYDAEGGGWAPAKNHSVFLTLGDSREDAKTSFTLAESKPLDPNEALAAVRRDRDQLQTPSARRVDGPTRSESHLPPTRDESFARWDSSDQDVYAAWERSGAAIPEWLEPSHSNPRDRAKSFVGAATAALAGMGTALILVVLVWDSIGRPLATARAGAQEPPPSAVAPESPVVPPGISTGMSTAELQAFTDMVTEMQKLRSEHRVSRVPNVWLEGVYFSRAIDYPEVRDFWASYVEYVRAMQATEGEAYRRSFVSHLERQGVGTSALSMLLARAMRTFEADRARRDALYASMLEMGTTALQLHDLLAAHEGQISFEPARAGVSRDPVVEAVAENAKLTAEMNDLLDRMFVAIERAQGERVVPRNELLLALERSLIPNEAANR